MDTPWHDLREDVQKCLLLCLRRESARNMNSQQVSNSIYGLCKMDVLWLVDLSNDDRSAIQKAIIRVKDELNEQVRHHNTKFYYYE